MKVMRTAALVLVSLILSQAAWAQIGGGITGVVRDTSGAVLPGVTVEAASPALIEKVRTVVTDGQGRFNVTALTPGTYVVSFTLPGFATFKREGIVLSSGFTATANADMKVGGLEETVTVTGASPVVDIQNVRSQSVMKYETLEALPSGARDLTQFASLTLGATASTAGRNDVGGAMAESNTGLTIHGGRGDDAKMNYDGMNTNGFWGGGGGQMRVFKFNTVGVQETVIETAGNSAESETGGANVNMVPRDGGNLFSLHSILAFTNTDLASGKVPADLIARGSAPSQNSMKKVWDYGAGAGGPIAKDRLWFYSSARWWGGQSYAANNFFDKSPVFYRYEADLTRPAYSDFWTKDIGGRITLQATQKHKLTSSVNWQQGCGCWLALSAGSPESPDAATNFKYGTGIPGGGMAMSQTTWTYPVTNRLLFQAGANFLIQTTNNVSTGTNVRITEQLTGYSWGSMASSAGQSFGRPQGSNNFSQRVSVSYVTGSHSFKGGLQTQQGGFEFFGNSLPNGTTYLFRNGAPLLITQWASPFENNTIIRRESLFAQDQWTIRKLTLNLGVRFDHFNAYTDARTVPAGPFTAARSVPESRDLPNFKDITPRIGVAYDLFGNGKTAIKGSWGRYLMGLGGGDASNLSPSNSIIQNTTRPWTDTNGDFVPNCDLRNLQVNGECGTVANLAFGQPISATAWAPQARTGWNTREFSYQYSLAIQHELTAGLGLTVSYHHTDWHNQQAVVNRALSPSDYTPYCITAPTDARLEAFSGKQVCGLFDPSLAKLGQVDNVRMLAKDVPGANGRPKEIFNGVDFAMNARFGKGGLVQGGVTLGRTLLDFCWMNSLPNVTQVGVGSLPRTSGYCDVQTPLWNGVGSQIKLQAVYPLPFAFVLSGTYKNLPGVPISANYILTNAQVAPALGRDLSVCRGAVSCAQTVTVPVLPSAANQGNLSAALFDTRLNQVDLRVTRPIRIGKARVQPTAELYNAFNSRPPQGILATYGAAWKRPLAILGGRLFKFGAQIDF